MKYLTYIYKCMISLFNMFTFRNPNYDNLALALIGGELTLLTLFFTIIPLVIDRKKETYLGENIAEKFLSLKKDKGYFKSTWKRGLILVLLSIIFSYLGFDYLFYLIFIIFIIYLNWQIITCLDFLNDDSEIKGGIEKDVISKIKSSSEDEVEQMVNNSNKGLKYIYENMDFLYRNNQISFLEKYVDRITDYNNNDESRIYNKVIKYIKNKKYNYNIKLPYLKLYIYIRNNINEQTKEDFYDFCFSLILNNYNICTNAKETTHNTNLVTLIFKSINDSKLPDDTKNEVKDRLLRDLYIYMNVRKEFLPRSNDEKYFKEYKYIFDIFKNVIDNNDNDIYDKMIKYSYDLYSKSDIMNDVYLTCIIYFYYLIKKENIRYVSTKEKKCYEKMYNEIKINDILYDVEALQDFIEQYSIIFENMDRVSYDWEKFDLSNITDIKYTIVEPMMDEVKKSLYIIMGKNQISQEYNISDDILKLFDRDLENGKLKIELKNKIKQFSEFIKYDYKEVKKNYSIFESNINDYIIRNFKEKELNEKIKIDKLKKALSYTKRKINTEMKKHYKVDNTIKKFNDKFILNLNLNSYFFDLLMKSKNAELIDANKIVNYFEKKLYSDLEKKIKNEVKFSFTSRKKIIDNLINAKKDMYYLRPKNDLLSKYVQVFDRMDYDKLISKFKIIDINTSNDRFLVEDYELNVSECSIRINKLKEQEIQNKMDGIKNENGVYYIENYLGIQIPLNREEFAKYIKSNEVNIIFEIKYNFKIYGKENKKFIYDIKLK